MTDHSPGKKKAPPPLVRALECIGKSDLDPGEKNVCRTLLEWWNDKTCELWPAIGTVASQAGMTLEGVRGILQRLETKGVVAILERSKGGVNSKGQGKTHRMRFVPPGWSNPAPNPKPGWGFNPQPRDAESPTETARTPNRITPNPQSRWGEPSIHPSIQGTIQ